MVDIESEASSHCTADEPLFSSLHPARLSSVLVTEKSSLPGTGQGNVPVEPGKARICLLLLAATNSPGVSFEMPCGVSTFLCNGKLIVEATCLNGLPSFVAEHASGCGERLC
jgi:hypothetical protein